VTAQGDRRPSELGGRLGSLAPSAPVGEANRKSRAAHARQRRRPRQGGGGRRRAGGEEEERGCGRGTRGHLLRHVGLNPTWTAALACHADRSGKFICIFSFMC
jgi:hypothetical protein